MFKGNSNLNQINNQRGGVLLVVALMIVVMSAVVNVSTSRFDSTMSLYSSHAAKRRLFYMSEGVRALATALIQQFIQENPNPSDEAMEAFLNNSLPPFIPDPFQVSPIDVETIRSIPNGTISSGPFQGMNSPLTDLAFRFTLSTSGPLYRDHYSETLDLRITFAFISMFQFIAFFDTTQAHLNVGRELDVRGHVHANSDLCLGSRPDWTQFLKLTVSGRLMSSYDPRCGGDGSEITNVRIATSPAFDTFQTFSNAYDNGCTDCDNTGLSWDSFSLARWRGQVLDEAHRIPTLKLPGAGAGTVQRREAGNHNTVENADNLRMIVDPVLSTDSQSIRNLKFAHNAHIRIINGVWYLKNPLLPNDWPGVPIWSDHPGRFSEYSIPVGQDDIRDRWNSTSYVWPPFPATPRNFSYYEYNSVASTIVDDPVGVGVISYGALTNSGAPPTIFKPAQWLNASGANSMCMGGAALDCVAGACGFVDIFGASPVLCAGASAVGRDPSYASNILNATRSGFRNGHVNEMSFGDAAERAARSRILPINFDVHQLQQALQNTGPGELGSYFGAGSFMGTPFNGVVYISSDYPGSLDGFTSGFPADYPFQGSVSDPNQIAATHGSVQQALPQALCSTSAAGAPFDLQGAVRRFSVPNCAVSTYLGYPNSIRVINGATLDESVLTRGLSIVSNIPVYLTGDYNTSSVVTSLAATPWVSSLIAGDKVSFLSTNWTDGRSRWDTEPSSSFRPAVNTTYNTAILSEPSEKLSVLHEYWVDRSVTTNGSMVYGFDAVYAQHDNHCCGYRSYHAATNRYFNFDPHFHLISNQPPGTPVFPVTALSSWARPR